MPNYINHVYFQIIKTIQNNQLTFFGSSNRFTRLYLRIQEQRLNLHVRYKRDPFLRSQRWTYWVLYYHYNHHPTWQTTTLIGDAKKQSVPYQLLTSQNTSIVLESRQLLEELSAGDIRNCQCSMSRKRYMWH